MSEHTQGRIQAIRWVDGLSALRPEESSENYFGGTPVVELIGGSMYEANARRLAAAWNACEGISTELLEAEGVIRLSEMTSAMGECNFYRQEFNAAQPRIAKLEALVAERDAMLGKRPCQNSRCNELNSIRDLLRKMVYPPDHETATQAGIRRNRAKDYLNACDTLEGNKPVDAIGCRKCGDILPAGHYCKGPACPLNPSMKGK